MQNLNIQDHIFPIFKYSAEDVPIELAGTGFFVGNSENIVIITAAHIMDLCPLAEGEKYGFIMFGDNTEAQKGFHIPKFKRLPDLDIAWVSFKNSNNFSFLRFIEEADMPLNEGIVSYDFASTTITPPKNPTDKAIINLAPMAHRGHVVRFYESDYPEKRPTFCFDTSFPVLQGASGAPVVRESSLTVIGVMVANVERHLLPAQTITIKDGAQYHEETKYYMPFGKAIATSEIVKGLRKSGFEIG